MNLLKCYSNSVSAEFDVGEIASAKSLSIINEIDERKCGIDVIRTPNQLLHVYTLASGSLVGGREGGKGRREKNVDTVRYRLLLRK